MQLVHINNLMNINACKQTLIERLEIVCQAIRQGQPLGCGVLGSVLDVAISAESFKVNDALARAYLAAGDTVSAATFAGRAFLFAGLSEEFLAFYIKLHQTKGDIAAQRAAYKTMGMRYAATGDTYSALRNFNLHRDAYALAGHGNRYEYDFDVLAEIDRLAAVHAKRLKQPWQLAFQTGKRTRLAYLVFHIHHPESVIVKLLCEFAKCHDQKKFEVVFFVVESSTLNNATTDKNLAALKNAGANVVQADRYPLVECALQIRDKVAQFDPDLFIAAAALAEYAHYFTMLASPATARIGLVYGPPELYIGPRFDWVIASSNTLLLDSPVDGSVIPIEYTLPDRAQFVAKTRGSLGISTDAVVLMSAGRSSKFMDQCFWRAIVQALALHPLAVFVAVGLDVDPPFLAELLTVQLASRVIRLGWQTEYLTILVNADIVVDTYPSGGGIVLVDAMALGIPVVSFRHDYTRPYDQMNWNLGEELVVVPELLLDRYQLDGLRDLLSALIEDKDRRAKLGLACKAVAVEQRGSPAKYVQQHEAEYVALVARMKEKHAAMKKICITINVLNTRIRRAPFVCTLRHIYYKFKERRS